MSWCEEKDTDIDWIGWRGRTKPYPKRIRCKKCGRRLKTFIRECHDVDCMHLYLPKHKAKVKVKKLPTRHERSTSRRLRTHDN